MTLLLGSVSAQGEARRLSPEWARAQDARARSASDFLQSRLPKGQEVKEWSDRLGTRWEVRRGSDVPANLRTSAEFLRKFPGATFRALNAAEEYWLPHEAPRAALRATVGKAFCRVYAFAALAACGAALALRPEWFSEAAAGAREALFSAARR